MQKIYRRFFYVWNSRLFRKQFKSSRDFIRGIGKLAKLEHLDVSFNPLKNGVDEISRLKNLKRLELREVPKEIVDYVYENYRNFMIPEKIFIEQRHPELTAKRENVVKYPNFSEFESKLNGFETVKIIKELSTKEIALDKLPKEVYKIVDEYNKNSEEADDKAYLRSTKEEYAERIYNALVEQYNNKEAELGSDLMRKLEKHILFDVVDNRWRGHLKSLDALRESIYLRAYGQRDPVTEYKLISSQIFEEMIATIQEQATSFLFKVVVNTEPTKDEEDEIEEAEIKEVNTENTDGLCPCGSGKPYEKCCGR